jgi:hypothetical protein
MDISNYTIYVKILYKKLPIISYSIRMFSNIRKLFSFLFHDLSIGCLLALRIRPVLAQRLLICAVGSLRRCPMIKA